MESIFYPNNHFTGLGFIKLVIPFILYPTAWIFNPLYRLFRVCCFLFYWVFFIGIQRLLSRRRYHRILPSLLEGMGRDFRLLCMHLEGLFIKAGQFLSIAGFFLPTGFKRELEGLQDAGTPNDFTVVSKNLVAHYGKPLSEVFADFSSEPIAVASIAQVHCALLQDGTQVAVKVQHVHIARIASADLWIIRQMLLLIGYFFGLRDLNVVFEQIRALILREIDFSQEGESLQAISSSMANDSAWRFPRLYPELSGNRILVMDWMNGLKISDVRVYANGKVKPEIVVDRLWDGFGRMVFEHGRYHADPHPGNVLIDERGSIVLLDFGAVGELSPDFRKHLPLLFLAFASSDLAELSKLLVNLGFVQDGPDTDSRVAELASALHQFLDNHIQELFSEQGVLDESFWRNPVSQLVVNAGIRNISGMFRIPKEYVLLGRTLSLLVGVSLILRPGVNPMLYLRPVFEKYAKIKKRNPMAWTDFILRTGRNALGLTQVARQAGEQFYAGNSSLKTPDIWRSARLIYLLGQQMILLAVTFAMGFFTYKHITSGRDGWESFLLSVSTGFFLVLLLRKWRVGNRLFRENSPVDLL